MVEIRSRNETISQNEINLCIKEFEFIRDKNNPKLKLIMEKEILDIDSTIFAYFTLFKNQNPNIEIELHLTSNPFFTEKNILNNRLIAQIRQFWLYMCLSVQTKPFRIFYERHEDKLTLNYALSNNKITTVSNSFLPPIFIDNHTYFNLYFDKDYLQFADINIELLIKTVLIEFVKNKDTLDENQKEIICPKTGEVLKNYKILKVANIKRQIINTEIEGFRKNIIKLASLAFVETLENAKILEVYLYSILKKSGNSEKINSSNLKMGNLIYDRYESYYSSIKTIYNELLASPLIYQFVFSLLLTSEVKNKKNNSKWEFKAKSVSDGIYAKNLSNLWEFSKKLVRGITELAKNTIEHSTTKKGIITARIIKKENKLYKKYYDFLEWEDTQVLDSIININVLDLGTKGVITTLIESTKKIYSEVKNDKNLDSLKDLLDEDLSLMNSKKIEFENLMNPDTNIFLLQQAKKSIAHFGLLTLSKLISEEKGAVYASTCSLGNNLKRDIALIPSNDTKKAKALNQLEFNTGTQLSIILPVSIKKQYKTTTHAINIPAKTTTQEEIESLEKLAAYELITDIKQVANREKTYVLHIEPDVTGIRNRKDEELLKQNILASPLLKKSLPNKILCLDLGKCGFTEKDTHILFRLLGSLDIYIPEIPLIIVNIKYNLLSKLLETNKLFCEHSNIEVYWSEDEPTIVYSFDENAKEDKFYFTDVLWGKSEQDLIKINHLISNTNYNSISTLSPSNLTVNTNLPNDSNLLINRRLPLPFDVLIKSGSKSLFEINASVLLTSNLIPNQQENTNDKNLINQITMQSGYKIPNTHFKVGSKVHINDFYYAKRFFQNGVYASHMAFLLAKDIKIQINDQNEIFDENGKPDLTLIGYGLYSELLLSLTERFLNNFFSEKSNDIEKEESKINHDIIVNSTTLKLQKGIKSNNFAIVIIPISTTFSSAIKIQESLYERRVFKKNKILSPLYTLLYISDTEPSNTCTKAESQLGWEDKNKNVEDNLISIKATYNNEFTNHKYYIPLPTKWNILNSCEKCYPARSTQDEEILFETDISSVTPSLIFTAPKGRYISDENLYREDITIENLVQYGHHRRNKHHFLHSIKSEGFLKENLKTVVKWLYELKINPHFTDNHHNNERVLIISQCHHTNAAFINLVNKYLFSSSANIIHYDPNNDFIQNFKMIYGKEIFEAERIVFVDDSLKSGKTLRRMHFYIQSSLDAKDKKKGIHTCITLMNKSQEFTQQWVNDLLLDNEGIHSFYNRHLYTDHEQHEVSSIEKEQQRYSSLLNSSSLDSLKQRFLKQIDKVSENGSRILSSNTKPELILNATHFLIEFFSKNSEELLIPQSFSLFFLKLKKDKLYKHLFKDDCNTDIEAAFFKVLTRPPFTLHMPVQKAIFPWVLENLNLQIDNITTRSANDKLTKDDIKYLKFYIRRACLLNSNILISKRFITVLKDGLFKESNYQLDQIDSDDFIIFYVQQVKELLIRNSSRCIVLQKNILGSIDSTSSGYFKQLIRVLATENTLLISDFSNFIKEKEKWIKLYGETDNIPINDDNKNIIEYIENPPISGNSKLIKLNEFLTISGEKELGKNKAFLNFLWLNHFFDNDKNNKITKKDKKNTVISLREKTEVILNKMGEIIELGVKKIDINLNKINIGKFLIIDNHNSKPLVVFSQDEDGFYTDENISLNENKHPLLMLAGIKSRSNFSNISVIELHKDINKKWSDLYATDSQGIDPLVMKTIISENCNRLLMFRINEMSLNPSAKINKELYVDKPLGVIGFYFKIEKKKEREPIPPNIIKYILLSRNKMSQFIQNHHNNNEFVEFQKANTIKKLASLTGHGQDILRQIAGSGNGMFGAISANLTKIQSTILFVTEEQKKSYDPFKIIAQTGQPEIFSYEKIQKLRKLVEEIYEYKEIENSIDHANEITLSFPTKKSFKEIVPDNFKIDMSILEVICYELFVNAKKNRWIFFDSESHTIEGIKYSKNLLSLELTKWEEGFSLIISNTAPQNSEKFIRRLNTDNLNTKKYASPVSGINLIKKLVHHVLKDANIFFKTKEEEGDSVFSIFSVEIQFEANSENHVR